MNQYQVAGGGLSKNIEEEEYEEDDGANGRETPDLMKMPLNGNEHSNTDSMKMSAVTSTAAAGYGIKDSIPFKPNKNSINGGSQGSLKSSTN